MSKKHKFLIRGGTAAGLILLPCFCCLIFRTRVADIAMTLPVVSEVAYNHSAGLYYGPAWGRFELPLVIK